MNTQQSAVRLFCLIAREAPVGVVFRRGPTKLVQLLRWNLADDTFVAGQWFKGRIYERRCDLSPSGRLLVYFAASQRPPYRSWTAISRPPYLTALALWPKGDAWGGGGLLPSDNTLEINHRDDELQLAPDMQLPDELNVTQFGTKPGWGEDDPIFESRLQRDGWKLTAQGNLKENSFDSKIWYTAESPRVWEKGLANVSHSLVMELQGIKEKGGPWYVLRFKLREGSDCVDLGRCDWADLLTGGAVLFARDGQLFRVSDPASVANTSPLIDLRPNKFEQVIAPAEAQRW
jgi:hypothetical protein